MTYQDKWLNGAAAEKGERECADRYQIVKAFCERYERPFTVCDVGANMCYFGLRLTEDFPLCSVLAFEFDHFELRLAHLKQSKADRVLLMNRKLSLADAKLLSSFCHFDVVLALSVMHHLPGPFNDWLKELRALGENLIAEFALDDSERVSIRKGYQVPSDAVVLGHGESHLKPEIRRPIVVLSGLSVLSV